MIQTGKITALYARFSHDEGNSGHDSNSIANQKELLAEYANTHGFINHQFYTDDGYSGTNFERPAFQKMMTDVENGLIGTIIGWWDSIQRLFFRNTMFDLWQLAIMWIPQRD